MKFNLMHGIISIGLASAAARVPVDIVRKLNADIDAWLKALDMQTRWKEMGVTPLGSSTGVAAKFFASEIVKWNRVINAAGIRGDRR